MKTSAALRKVVTDFGWLAVREILFDNNVVARPMNCDGCIAMDTDNTIYWIYSTTTAEFQAYVQKLVSEPNRSNSAFKHIKMKDGDHVQGIDLHVFADIHTYIDDVIKKPANKTFDFNANLTDKIKQISVEKKAVKFDPNGIQDMLDDNSDPSVVYEFDETRNTMFAHEVIDAIDIGDGTYFRKDDLETFNANQAAFRVYIETLLGIDTGTLI